jgi:ABC-type branched-subunit amino acid transport system permease subunit
LSLPDEDRQACRSCSCRPGGSRLPAIGSTSSWLTLTVSGLAMGMMIFIMASGLTLVFGLMDVINFGHGAFISVGAYVGIFALLALERLDRRRRRCCSTWPRCSPRSLRRCASPALWAGVSSG